MDTRKMIPPVIEKRRYRIGWLFLGISVGCMVVVCLLLFFGFHRQWPWLLTPYPCLGAVAVANAFVISLRVKESRLKKGVKAAHYQICTDCLYNLEGHESLGICPECGTPFTARGLETDWREFTDPDRRFWRFP